MHRYTFPESRSARLVIDLSCGGLAISHGRTVPLRAQVESLGHGRAQGTVVMEGVPLSVYLEVSSPDWLGEIRALAADDDRVVLLTDVDDDEKPLLMRGCATYALPTKEEPDFVETFGIALTEKLLAGGGPVITTITGGTGEAVGDAAVIVPAGDIPALTAALDRVVLEMSEHERRSLERRGREHAMAFDRTRVFDDLFDPDLPVRAER